MSGLRLDSLRSHLFGPVDLEVAPGECVVISGPSGAGKTVFLRAIADLDPHEGAAYLDGQECSQVPAPLWRRLVGLLPAEPLWWEDAVGSHMPDCDPALLEALGLPRGCLEWEVSRLSSGERQRLGLARLLSRQPRALLLDEPTGSLDPENTARLEDLVLREAKRLGWPVIWISHDPRQVERIADRAFVMESGRLREARA